MGVGVGVAVGLAVGLAVGVGVCVGVGAERRVGMGVDVGSVVGLALQGPTEASGPQMLSAADVLSPMFSDPDLGDPDPGGIARSSWDVRRGADSQMGGVIEDWPVKRKLRASSEQHRSDRETPKQAVLVKLRLTERASCSRVSACGSFGAAVLLCPPVEQNLALLVGLDTSSVTSRWWRSARV